MKYFATIASLFLLVNGIASLATHHGQHSSKRHHEHSVFQSRAAGDSCDWKCVDQNGNAVTAGNLVGSWAIDIVGGAAATVTLSIFYDSATNVYIIFNRAVNIAIVFKANLGFFAVLNLSTSKALLVNFSNKYAMLVSLTADIVGAFSTDISLAISLSSAFMTSYASTAGTILIMTAAKSFNLGLLLTGMSLGSLSYNLVFVLNGSLQAEFTASFGSLMTAAAARLSAGIYASSYGVFNILVGVFGTTKGVQQAFLGITFYLAVTAGGFVSANMSAAFNLTFNIAVYMGALVAGTLTGVTVAAGGVLSFVAASGAVAFTVGLTGVVSIAGAAVGFAGGVIAALSSVLSFSSSISASISFGFGFSIGK